MSKKKKKSDLKKEIKHQDKIIQKHKEVIKSYKKLLKEYEDITKRFRKGLEKFENYVVEENDDQEFTEEELDLFVEQFQNEENIEDETSKSETTEN